MTIFNPQFPPTSYQKTALVRSAEADYGCISTTTMSFANGPNINKAILQISQAGGGILTFGPGIFYIRTDNNGYVVPKDNVILQGAGMGATTLLFDDTYPNPNYGIKSTASLNNFHIRDMTLKGFANSNQTSGMHIVYLGLGGSNISLKGVEITYSRGMGFAVEGFDRVLIEGCRLINTNADGFNITDSSNVDVISNYIRGAGDDAISLHTNDDASIPLRSSIRVIGNTIEESQGIVSLGAKGVVIANNVLRRMMAYGICVTVGNGFAQGHTPIIGVDIHDNVIEDVFQRSDSGTIREQEYVRLGGGIAQAGTGTAVPGYPTPSTGVVPNLYGANTGNFYGTYWNATTNTLNPNIPVPGGYWVRLERNIFIRTLPSVAHVSDWGYSTSGMWVGKQNGVQNLAVTEAQLNTRGVFLEGTLKNSLIKDNIFQTTAFRCIEFSSTSTDLDFDNLVIDGNQFIDYQQAGIFHGTTLTQRISVINNTFDADPHFSNTNRGSNGTWAANNWPFGIYIPYLSGVDIRGNRFRNLCDSVITTKTIVVKDNIIYCDPTAAGQSTLNKGVYNVHAGGAEYSHIIEVCDPTDANYGKIKSSTVFASNAAPTTGTYVIGHFVTNTNPVLSSGSVITGWLRLTTGSNNVLGTDWTACKTAP